MTLFTSDTHESYLYPTVTLTNSPLPIERHPKLLDVTFDTHCFFAQHTTTVKKAAETLKILKVLVGTNGTAKISVIIAYKAPVWFALSYCA